MRIQVHDIYRQKTDTLTGDQHGLELQLRARFPEQARQVEPEEGLDALLDWINHELLGTEVAVVDDDEPLVKAANEDGNSEVKSQLNDSPDLVVQHNIRAAGLVHAHQLGGLVAPSIAVANRNHPLTEFGEISLIGDHTLVDPKHTPVFEADVYSPRWPTTRYKVNHKAVNQLVDHVGQHAKPVLGSQHSYIDDMDTELEKNGVRDLVSRSRFRVPLATLYFHEKGDPIQPIMSPARLHADWLNMPAMHEFKAKHGLDPYHDADSDYHKALSAASREAIQQWRQHLVEKLKAGGEDPVVAEQDAKDISAHSDSDFNDDGLLVYSRSHKVAQSLGKLGTLEPDNYGVREAIEDKLKQHPHDKDFDSWLEQKLRPLEGEPYIVTEGGARRKYTVENILAQMTRKIRAGEGFNYGLGTARSMGAVKFHDLVHMKNSHHRMVAPEEFRKQKAALDLEFGQLADQVGGYHQFPDGFRVMGDLAQAIGESYRPGSNIRRALKTNNFRDLPAQHHSAVAAFAKKLYEMPTEYFEAKPQRLVGIHEFRAAVIPKDTGAEARSVLAHHRLAVHEYDPGIPGDHGRAVAKATEHPSMRLSEAQVIGEPLAKTPVEYDPHPLWAKDMLNTKVRGSMVRLGPPKHIGDNLYVHVHGSKYNHYSSGPRDIRYTLTQGPRYGRNLAVVEGDWHISPDRFYADAWASNVGGKGYGRRLMAHVVSNHGSVETRGTVSSHANKAFARLTQEHGIEMKPGEIGVDRPHVLTRKSEPLEKGMGSVLLGLVAGAALHAHPVWHPKGLDPEMMPIAHLESSMGRNVNHARGPLGFYDTAFGAVGLKPTTAHEQFLRTPELQRQYPDPDLKHIEHFTTKMQADPLFYNRVASQHWRHLKAQLGSPEAAAYGWNHGPSAAKAATPEQIHGDTYVTRYKALTEARKTPVPMKKSEPVVLTPVAPVEIIYFHKKAEQPVQKSDSDANLPDIMEAVEDMHGFRPQALSLFAAARWLTGGEPASLESMRRALWDRGEDLEAAALQAYRLDVNDQNRKALRSVQEIGDLHKAEAVLKLQGPVVAGVPEAEEAAADVAQALESDDVEPVKLGGKHSAGTYLVRGKHHTYLLKPGSGSQSPASGAKQEEASQSRREAAFWHAARAWDLESDIPRADLLVCGGREYACIRMLSWEWRNLSKVMRSNHSRASRALDRYRQDGKLAQWALLDWVFGNPDRHGQNLMLGPDGEIKLIDHGSAFAGPAFDPAHDRSSFIPFYLRSGVDGDRFNQMSVSDKLSHMPVLPQAQDQEFRSLVHGLSHEKLVEVLTRYGINPDACLGRLQALLTAPGRVSEALDRLFVEV